MSLRSRRSILVERLTLIVLAFLIGSVLVGAFIMAMRPELIERPRETCVTTWVVEEGVKKHERTVCSTSEVR